MPVDNTPELDYVDHPVLGRLSFPKDMGFAQRNAVIAQHVHERQVAQQFEQVTHPMANVAMPHSNMPAFNQGGWAATDDASLVKERQEYAAAMKTRAQRMPGSKPLTLQEFTQNKRQMEAVQQQVTSPSGVPEMMGNAMWPGAATAVAETGRAALHPNEALEHGARALAGAGEAVSPFIGVSAIKEPVQTGIMLGLGAAGSVGAQKGVEALGGSPEAQEFASQGAQWLIPGAYGAMHAGAAAPLEAIRAKRFAEQLRAQGVPEGEVLARSANPPWARGPQQGLGPPLSMMAPQVPTPQAKPDDAFAPPQTGYTGNVKPGEIAPFTNQQNFGTEGQKTVPFSPDFLGKEPLQYPQLNQEQGKALFDKVAKDVLDGYVYHGTTTDRASQIMKEGFRPLRLGQEVKETFARLGVKGWNDIKSGDPELSDQDVKELISSLLSGYKSQLDTFSVTPAGEVATRWAGKKGEISSQIEKYITGKYPSGDPAVVKGILTDVGKKTEQYERLVKDIQNVRDLMAKTDEERGYPATWQQSAESLWHEYTDMRLKPEHVKPLSVLTGESINRLRDVHKTFSGLPQDLATPADKGLEGQRLEPKVKVPSWQDIASKDYGFITPEHGSLGEIIKKHGDAQLLIRYTNGDRKLMMASEFHAQELSAISKGDEAAEEFYSQIRDGSLKDPRFTIKPTSKLEGPRTFGRDSFIDFLDTVIHEVLPDEPHALSTDPNKHDTLDGMIDRFHDLGLLKEMGNDRYWVKDVDEIRRYFHLGEKVNSEYPDSVEDDVLFDAIHQRFKSGEDPRTKPPQTLQERVEGTLDKLEEAHSPLGTDYDKMFLAGSGGASTLDPLEQRIARLEADVAGQFPKSSLESIQRKSQRESRSREGYANLLDDFLTKSGADRSASTKASEAETSTTARPPQRGPAIKEATPLGTPKGLSETGRKTHSRVTSLESALNKQGFGAGIEEIRAAVGANKLKADDSLYVYEKALRAYAHGLHKSDKWALKNALDVASNRGGPDSLQMRILPVDTLVKLYERWKSSLAAGPDPAHVELVHDMLLQHADNMVREINPYFGNGLTMDGWTFGHPRYGEYVNVTYRGKGAKAGDIANASPTMSVPLNVATDPNLLHDFANEFLKSFGISFPHTKTYAAGAGSFGLAFFPTDVLEAGLRTIQKGSSMALRGLERAGLEGGPLTPENQARTILRERTGKLARSKEQLFDRFNKPEINPASLSRSRYVGELAKRTFGSHFGAKSLLETAMSRWNSATPKDFLSFTDRMERGDIKGMSPADQRIATQLRTMLDDRWSKVQKISEGAADIWIENYFPHMWSNVGKAQDFARSVMTGRRPLEGPKSFLKERYYDTTLKGMAAGLEPITYNPIRMALTRMHEIDRFLMAHEVKADLEKRGLAQFARSPADAPEGWVPLNDKIFVAQKMAEDRSGMIRYGSWYAPADAARIVNNYLSPGLRGKKIPIFPGTKPILPAFDIVRGYGNFLNQAQLGLSPFHLYFTAFDSMTSDFAMALEHLEHGNVGKAAFHAARTPVAWAFNFLRGNKLMAEYLEPGRYTAYSQLADMLSKAGGRVAMDPYFKNGSIDAFWKAFHTPGMAKAKALRYSPFALAEVLSKPIMEKVVPRMKLGIFADMAQHLHEQFINGEIDQPTFRKGLNDAWDSVDNRMGQLVYDNVGMTRMGKDLMMLTIRSVGWNVGTVREVGGGAIKDTGTHILNLASGRTPLSKSLQFTRRMNYVLSLGVVMGFVNGVMNYAYTGQMPHGLDYLAPRDGKLDESGHPSRVFVPGYHRDIVAVWHDPLMTAAHKLAPWAPQMYELFKNEDFWGTEISHGGDPRWKRVLERAAYIGKSFEPLSLQNYFERRKLGASRTEAISTYGLAQPTPKYIGKSDAEFFLSTEARKQMSRGPKTKEQFQQGEKVWELRNKAALDMRIRGDLAPSDNVMQELMTATANGTITPQAMNRIIKQASLTPLQRNLDQVDPATALEAWQKMDKHEQDSVSMQMLRQVRRISHQPPEKQAYLLQQYMPIIERFSGQAKAVADEPDDEQ